MCVYLQGIWTDVHLNRGGLNALAYVFLTFCSHSSLRSSLWGELPTPHCGSNTSSWLTWWPPVLPSITAPGSTVSSFTLHAQLHTQLLMFKRSRCSWHYSWPGNEANHMKRTIMTSDPQSFTQRKKGHDVSNSYIMLKHGKHQDLN